MSLGSVLANSAAFYKGLANKAGNIVSKSFDFWDKAFDPTGIHAQNNEYEKNLALQQQAQAYNSAEAEKNRQWQEYMSNTAYSRAFKDLEAAGYNPYLALTAGSMASTPSGASGSSSAASVSRQNNKTLDVTTKAVAGIMKLGQSSASNLQSVARIIALAIAAL